MFVTIVNGQYKFKLWAATLFSLSRLIVDFKKVKQNSIYKISFLQIVLLKIDTVH